MTNEELNTRLYEKMFAEQEQFRDWLLSQPPAEILNHAYEYTVREDILMSLEYHDLEDSQARALLKSDKPLKQIFERWENQETSYMDTVWDTVQEQAVAAGLFCRKMDGRFCRKKPDTDVRRAGRIDVAGVFCRTREGRGQSRSLH